MKHTRESARTFCDPRSEGSSQEFRFDKVSANARLIDLPAFPQSCV